MELSSTDNCSGFTLAPLPQPSTTGKTPRRGDACVDAARPVGSREGPAAPIE